MFPSTNCQKNWGLVPISVTPPTRATKPAAIYLDRGFDFAKHIIIDRIVKVHIDIDELQQTDINFKSKLLEWSQKQKKSTVFKMLEEIGEGHKKQFHVQIVIDGEPYADAIDRSIRGAEQLAAEKTWKQLFGEN